MTLGELVAALGALELLLLALALVAMVVPGEPPPALEIEPPREEQPVKEKVAA